MTSSAPPPTTAIPPPQTQFPKEQWNSIQTQSSLFFPGEGDLFYYSSRPFWAINLLLNCQTQNSYAGIALSQMFISHLSKEAEHHAEAPLCSLAVDAALVTNNPSWNNGGWLLQAQTKPCIDLDSHHKVLPEVSVTKMICTWLAVFQCPNSFLIPT